MIQQNTQGRPITDGSIHLAHMITNCCPSCGDTEECRRDTVLLGDGLLLWSCLNCWEMGVTNVVIWARGSFYSGKYGVYVKWYPISWDDALALPGVPPNFGFPF